MIADQVAMAGRQVIGEIVNDIAREYDGTIPDDLKVAMADHFWRDLLAQLARVMDGEGFCLIKACVIATIR